MMPEQPLTRQELLDIDQRAGLSYGVNQSDELAFGELIAKDRFWISLVDGTTQDIDQIEETERNTYYANRLADPNTPAHILGGFLMRSLNEYEGWVTKSNLITKWFGGFGAKPTIQLMNSLMGIVHDLEAEGLIEIDKHHYRLHPDYRAEEDFLTPEDDFEEITYNFLRKRPLGVYAPYCVFNYFRNKQEEFSTDGLTPYEYWGIRYQIGRLTSRGAIERVPNDYSYLRLPKAPYANTGEEQDSLDDRIAVSRYGQHDISGQAMQEKLEEKLKGAGITSRIHIRKPQQRGRWKK